MAKKRKVEGGEAPQQVEEEAKDGDLPLWMQEQSWQDWFRRVFASRLFALACFAFDVFFGLELARQLSSEWSWTVLPVIAFFIAAQVAIYLHLWGKKGRLM